MIKYCYTFFEFVNFSLGIDLVHLIVQLTSGQRLSRPKFCPEPISGLMTECFRENPCERPDFDQITRKLQLAYDEMIKNSQTKSSLIEPEDSQPYTTLIHKAVNDKMKNQYAKLIAENKTQHKYSNVNKEKSKSSENCSLHYASIENLEFSSNYKEIC